MSQNERSGWRDQTISVRHRDWGYDCPFVDFDGIEYDHGLAVALIEYKNESAMPANPKHANVMALLDLADRGNRGQLPVFGCRYASDLSRFRVKPLNASARRFLPVKEIMTEKEWIRILYRIRDREHELELTLRFSEDGRLVETFDGARNLWRKVSPPQEMPENSDLIAALHDEIAALEADKKQMGRYPPHAERCASCGLLMNGSGFTLAGKHYHRDDRCNVRKR